MFAFPQNLCIIFAFTHKSFVFSHKSIAIPEKICVCSQNFSILSPKTLHSLINFAFAHKIFLFSRKCTAFLEKLFCLCTKLVHKTLDNILHYPRNFAIAHKTFSVLSQKYCIPQKISVLLHLLENFCVPWKLCFCLQNLCFSQKFFSLKKCLHHRREIIKFQWIFEFTCKSTEIQFLLPPCVIFIMHLHPQILQANRKLLQLNL